MLLWNFKECIETKLFFSVLCIQLQLISCVENKTDVTVKNGLRNALSIWALTYKNNKNMVVANLPLRMALNKLAVVATGKAKEQLLTTLGVTSDQNLTEYYPELLTTYGIRYAQETSLIMLNALFVKESDDMDPAFVKDNGTFGVRVQKTRFNMPTGVVKNINQWVEMDTFKRVTDVITEKDIDRSTSMVFINAIHMKLTWSTPFDIRLSLMKPFTLLNKQVVMMRMMTALETNFQYAESKEHDFQILSVDLDCPGCRIIYVLPREVTGLPRLLKLMEKHPDLIPNITRHLNSDKANVRLPIMKIKTFIKWNPYLRGIGVTEILDHNHSGLDAITKPNRTTKYHMSKFLSKVFLDVDEFGIHRKAPVKPLHLESLRLEDPMWQFIADHPFYFQILFDDYLGDIHEIISGVFYGTD